MARECSTTCGSRRRACVLVSSVQESTSVHVGERTGEQAHGVAALG
jgi:hypothetical protein